MISVCIATFNGELYIKEQLDSILPQITDNDEIIISDDSSTDRTLKIIEEYSERYHNIKILPNQTFHSAIFNFQNALQHATGDVIFLCDQDDVWLPNKVNVMIKALSNNDLVVSDCVIVDKNLNIIYPSFFKRVSSQSGFLKNLIKNSFIGCCMAFRKEVLNYILPFPKNLISHDMWIGLMVELYGKTHFINQPLLLYRKHGNNVTDSGGKSPYPLYYKLYYRCSLLFELLKRRYTKSNYILSGR